MLTTATSPAFKRLLHCLIIKSIADVLFIGLIAVGFYYNAFNPNFQGALDEAGAEWIRGWAIDQAAPRAHVEVQLYIDGKFAGSRLADYPRQELAAAGAAQGVQHGFFFYTPPLAEGEHEACVYTVHTSNAGRLRTMQIIGSPRHFKIDATSAEPFYRGWVDEATQEVVRGWVISREMPEERAEVHLYIDGQFVEKRVADYPRPDLLSLKMVLDAKHGFLFLIPLLAPGEHEARVYVSRADGNEQGRRLLLVGRPLRFLINPRRS